MRILLIEDDRKLASSIAKNLRAECFSVDHAYDGLEGEEHASVSRYDVIILDIRLPKQDGWTTCLNLRRNGISTPIIFLTAADDVSDKIKGLNCGADDYLTKPFSTAELAARIRALMRRPVQLEQTVIKHFGVTFDTVTHSVFRDGKEIILSAKEFALLELFMRYPGKIVTREMIMETVWDMNADPQSNVIDALVKLLRRKIDQGFQVQLILTVRGVGYKFTDRKKTC